MPLRSKPTQSFLHRVFTAAQPPTHLVVFGMHPEVNLTHINAVRETEDEEKKTEGLCLSNTDFTELAPQNAFENVLQKAADLNMS